MAVESGNFGGAAKSESAPAKAEGSAGFEFEGGVEGGGGAEVAEGAVHDEEGVGMAGVGGVVEQGDAESGAGVGAPGGVLSVGFRDGSCAARVEDVSAVHGLNDANAEAIVGVGAGGEEDGAGSGFEFGGPVEEDALGSGGGHAEGPAFSQQSAPAGDPIVDGDDFSSGAIGEAVEAAVMDLAVGSGIDFAPEVEAVDFGPGNHETAVVDVVGGGVAGDGGAIGETEGVDVGFRPGGGIAVFAESAAVGGDGDFLAGGVVEGDGGPGGGGGGGGGHQKLAAGGHDWNLASPAGRHSHRIRCRSKS